jgi:hypothetical protein
MHSPLMTTLAGPMHCLKHGRQAVDWHSCLVCCCSSQFCYCCCLYCWCWVLDSPMAGSRATHSAAEQVPADVYADVEVNSTKSRLGCWAPGPDSNGLGTYVPVRANPWSVDAAPASTILKVGSNTL